MHDVVCFGEVLWDVYEAASRRGEAVGRVFRRALGGAQANVATGLARLGVRVALVGAVGTDPFGAALLAQLEADGVDVRFLRRLPGRTGLTFVLAAAPGAKPSPSSKRRGGGEPRFFPYRQGAADEALLAEHLSPAAGRARWAVAGTNAPAEATERFFILAEQGRARLAVDLNVRAHLWPDAWRMRSAIASLARRASLVKASHADLWALGARGDGLGWLERNAPQATWLVTRGPGEASAIGEHGETTLPPAPSRCVDATGAGDAFLAGALATIVAARAVPGSGAWRTPELWGLALHAGHVMARKAISRRGAVAGLVGLGEVRRTADEAGRRFA